MHANVRLSRDSYFTAPVTIRPLTSGIIRINKASAARMRHHDKTVNPIAADAAGIMTKECRCSKCKATRRTERIKKMMRNAYRKILAKPAR